jgi:hypothetical protein
MRRYLQLKRLSDSFLGGLVPVDKNHLFGIGFYRTGVRSSLEEAVIDEGIVL